MTDRPYRTASNRCFNGGYTGHGPIEPLEYPSLWQRIGYAIENYRTHIGPVRSGIIPLGIGLGLVVTMLGVVVG